MDSIFDFKQIGHLKIDKVFFESYYPILFTCINEKKELFLCVCSQADSEQKKWLVTKVSSKTIIELLSNKITLRDSFLKDDGDKYTIIYTSYKQVYEIEKNNNSDWDEKNSIELPTPGEYIDAEENEFLEEIEYFQNISVRYNATFRQEDITINKNKIKIQEYGNVEYYKGSAYYTRFITNNIGELKSDKYSKVLRSKVIDALDSKNVVTKDLGKYINETLHSKSKVAVNDEAFSLVNTEGFCIDNKLFALRNFINAA